MLLVMFSVSGFDEKLCKLAAVAAVVARSPRNSPMGAGAHLWRRAARMQLNSWLLMNRR